MTTLEIVEALSLLEIVDGFSVRDGKIVIWEHETEIPESLCDFVALDVNA
jgi:hypothetical protein